MSKLTHFFYGINFIFATFSFSVTPLYKSMYYENWAQYRTNNGKYTLGTFPACSPTNFTALAQNIDEFNYAFALFNYNTQTSSVTNDWKVYFSEWDDYISGNVPASLTALASDLRTQNPNMKLMLSIGGWNFNDPTSSYGGQTYTFFQKLLSTTANQTAFINSLINETTGILFLKNSNGDYIFDGIDLDYEYPGQTSRGGAATDYKGFITLVTALRNNFESSSRAGDLYISTTIPPFIPTGVAGGAWTGGTYPANSPHKANTAYGGGTVSPTNPSTYFAWMSIVANLCDWVNLMAYDMYGAGFSGGLVKYQAPLYNGPTTYNATTVTDTYSIDYAIWMWTTGCSQATGIAGTGIAASTIMLGLPAYGRSYGFSSPINVSQNPVAYGSNPGLSYTQAGPALTYTQTPGVGAYFEIAPLIGINSYMKMLTNPQSKIASDPQAAQSYAILNNLQGLSPANMVMCYDSVSDFSTKTLYAQNKGLRGVFVYALSEDDLLNNTVTNSLYLNGIVNTLTNHQTSVNYQQGGRQTTFEPNITSR